MGRKLRLLWDFRGEDAKETALHHTKHLQEFTTLEKLDHHTIDIRESNPMLCSAFIIINEKDLKIYRDALKPHRGEII